MFINQLNPCTCSGRLPDNSVIRDGAVPFYERYCPHCGKYTAGLSIKTANRRWNALCPSPPSSMSPPSSIFNYNGGIS